MLTNLLFNGIWALFCFGAYITDFHEQLLLGGALVLSGVAYHEYGQGSMHSPLINSLMFVVGFAVLCLSGIGGITQAIAFAGLAVSSLYLSGWLRPA